MRARMVQSLLRHGPGRVIIIFFFYVFFYFILFRELNTTNFFIFFYFLFYFFFFSKIIGPAAAGPGGPAPAPLWTAGTSQLFARACGFSHVWVVEEYA